jgi:hypothetical protein
MPRFCPTQIDLAVLGHVPLYPGTGQSNQPYVFGDFGLLCTNIASSPVPGATARFQPPAMVSQTGPEESLRGTIDDFHFRVAHARNFF